MEMALAPSDSRCNEWSMKNLRTPVWIVTIALVGLWPAAMAEGTVTNYVRGQFHELNDNGAWSWFMDERAIVDREQLLVGSVRANGGFRDKSRPGWGNVELAMLDLKTGAKRVVLLHEKLEQDDHDNPGLLILQDGRYFAGYSKHGQEPKLYYRISMRPHDATEWMPEVELVTPGVKLEKPDWGNNDNFTYCNPLRLSAENNRTYLFHRGHVMDPNYLVSDDDGRTWK